MLLNLLISVDTYYGHDFSENIKGLDAKMLGIIKEDQGGYKAKILENGADVQQARATL